MANRTIQAKVLKMRRRGRFKTFSKGLISTGQGPNGNVIAEYVARARINPKQAALDARFPGAGGTAPKRVEVLKKLEKMLNSTPVERSVILFNGRFKRISLYFTEDHTIFFFMEEWIGTDQVRRSITYSNRTRAMQVYRAGKVVWVESTTPSQAP